MSFVQLPNELVKIISNLCPGNALRHVSRRYFSLLTTRISLRTSSRLYPLLVNIKKVETENMNIFSQLKSCERIKTVVLYKPTSELICLSNTGCVSLILKGEWSDIGLLKDVDKLTQIKYLECSLPKFANIPSFRHVVDLSISPVTPYEFKTLCALTQLQSLKVTGTDHLHYYSLELVKIPKFEFWSQAYYINLDTIFNFDESILRKLSKLKVIVHDKKRPISFLNFVLNDKRILPPDLFTSMLEWGFPIDYHFTRSSVISRAFECGNQILIPTIIEKFPEQLSNNRASLILTIDKGFLKLTLIENLLFFLKNNEFLFYIIEIALFTLEPLQFKNILEKYKPYIPNLSKKADGEFLLRLCNKKGGERGKLNFKMLVKEGFDPNKELFDCAIKINNFKLHNEFGIPLITAYHLRLALKENIKSFFCLLEFIDILPVETDGFGNNIIHLAVNTLSAMYPLLRKKNYKELLVQKNIHGQTPFDIALKFNYPSLRLLLGDNK